MPTVAFSIPGFRFSLPAAADLSAGQFKALIVDSSGDAARAGLSAGIIGVQQNKPTAAGQATEIIQSGITKAFFDEAITAGDDVGVDASGEFTVTVTGQIPQGVCLVGAGIDEIGTILLFGAPGAVT